MATRKSDRPRLRRRGLLGAILGLLLGAATPRGRRKRPIIWIGHR